MTSATYPQDPLEYRAPAWGWGRDGSGNSKEVDAFVVCGVGGGVGGGGSGGGSGGGGGSSGGTTKFVEDEPVVS